MASTNTFPDGKWIAFLSPEGDGALIKPTGSDTKLLSYLRTKPVFECTVPNFGRLAVMRTIIAFALPLSLVFGASLPSGAPEQAGVSRDRLNRINVVMREHIDKGHLAGASGLIARNGKIVFKETWGDYKPDTIVRMYSMTKAVTGVAAMMLYEEGRFSLTDPLSKYLPEFSNMRVGRESTDAAGKRIVYTVPVDHPITVRDLFRRSGGQTGAKN